MSKIMIDGVDVSECVELYELDEMVCIADGNEVSCKGKNCYYKQLKRLEQENEQLHKELQYKYEEMDSKGFILMGENLEYWKNLKEENKRLVNEQRILLGQVIQLEDELSNIHHNCNREGCKYYEDDTYKVFYKCKAKSTLEYIRYFIQHHDCLSPREEKILNKIGEVLE